MSASEQLNALGQNLLMNNYGRAPVVMARGEGCRLWDSDGRPYLDMTAGIAEAAKQKLQEMIPLARLGSAEDVANAVAWLASDQASYVTGEVLRVNGGMYM